jgi:hypothetical protein
MENYIDPFSSKVPSIPGPKGMKKIQSRVIFFDTDR